MWAVASNHQQTHMNNELKVQEAALAWAQGKRVEARPKRGTREWGGIDGVGLESDCNKYVASCFHTPEIYDFRLAPEPPAKKFRPWTPDEVPVGALIRAIGLQWRSLIWAAHANGDIGCMTGALEPEYALRNHEHSIDGGKTWLPCGVEVDG